MNQKWRAVLSLPLVLSAARLAQGSTIFDFVAGSAQSAGQFGILAGSNSAGSLVFQQSNEDWKAQSGNLLVGIGMGTSVGFSGGGSHTFQGELLFEQTNPVTPTPSYSAFSPTGGVVFGSNSQMAADLSVYNAISAATGISSQALSSASGVTTYTGGNITVAGGGTHYFSVNSNLNTGPVAISGSANDLVVVNVSGNAQLAFTGNVTLSGGIAADNVLFNFTGTSVFHGNNNGGHIPVDVIINSTGGANVDNSNFDGRIFDVASSGAFQLVSGFNVNSPGAIVTATPEPTSLIFSGVGLAMILASRLRSRR